MKRFLFIGLLAVSAVFPALGQTPAASASSKSSDEIAIRKLMEDVAVAWNQHDVVAFSRLFDEDADFTNWRG